MAKKNNKTLVESVSADVLKTYAQGQKEQMRLMKRFLKGLKHFGALLLIWALRIVMIPAFLFVSGLYFSTLVIPTIAIQVFGRTTLSTESHLIDQFTFYYLPMIAFTFVFGVIIIILICFIMYYFFKWTNPMSKNQWGKLKAAVKGQQ